jgi:hypothetical protein
MGAGVSAGRSSSFKAGAIMKNPSYVLDFIAVGKLSRPVHRSSAGLYVRALILDDAGGENDG